MAATLILFIVSLSLLLFNLGQPMIYILDEAKNAECAREMLVSGNYVVPQFNGQLRTDKPPLHYFFMAAAYEMFGVSAFSARFFSAVFGALTILIVYLFARKYVGNRPAIFSSIALLASLHFNFQMRLAVPDPYLIFWMTASFITFYLFITERRKVWLWLMYISIGLGLLTKGPVALALPGLIMLLFLLFTRRFTWNTISSFHIPVGIVIMLAVALPWYWLNYQATGGEWTHGFFFKHNLGRFSETMEGHGGFFLLPLLMVIVGLLPFGIFSVSSAVLAIKQRSNQYLLFCLMVVIVIVVFFSFSQTKLPNYTAPAYPFVALLIGYFFDRLIKGEIKSRSVNWAYACYTVFALAIPAGVYFGLKADPHLSNHSSLWVYFIGLPVGAAAGWFLIIRRSWRPLFYITAASFILTNIFFFAKAYPTVYANNPVSASVKLLENKHNVAYYGLMNSAYVFNMQRIIPHLSTREQLQQYLNDHPDAIIISRKSYQEEIEANTRLKPIFEQRDTFETPTTIIFE